MEWTRNPKERLLILNLVSFKKKTKNLFAEFLRLTGEELKAPCVQIRAASGVPRQRFSLHLPLSPHMTSARLSLTLFLCLVLALKAAELKRCYLRKKGNMLPTGCYHTANRETSKKKSWKCELKSEYFPLMPEKTNCSPFQIVRSCWLWRQHPIWVGVRGQRCLAVVGYTWINKDRKVTQSDDKLLSSVSC